MVELSKTPSLNMDAAEILNVAETSAELSPPLSLVIADAERVLVVAGAGVERKLLEGVFQKCGDKLGKVVVFGEASFGEEYFDKILEPDPSVIDDYKYFGATNGKTPILLHNEILNHDAAIVLGEISYDGLSGFSGGPNLIFPMLSPEKSSVRLFSLGLDFEKRCKRENCNAGHTSDNPIDSDIKEAIVTSSSGMNWFGINILKGRKGVYAATAGDLLFSYVSAQKIFDEYNLIAIDEPFDGIILEISAENLLDCLSLIESALGGLIKGGRMLICADNMNEFGPSDFRSFFNETSLENIFDKIGENSFSNPYGAFLLKKACSQYHIAIDAPLAREDLIQCGLNPLKKEAAGDFFKNCSNVGKIFNAARFTINK